MPKDGDKGKCVKLSFSDLVLSVLPWPFHKDLPANYCGKKPGSKFWDLVLLAFGETELSPSSDGQCVKLSLSDLVLSVLPWPFHKDLPANYCGKKPGNKIWDLFLLALRTQPSDEPREKIKSGN